MGIWDYISGTTDSLKRNTPDLTAVKNWCPTTESIKRIAPDVTAAKSVWPAAYGYGSASATQIDNAVRGNVKHYVWEEEGRVKIAQLAKLIIKHGIDEGLKTLPGYEIVHKSIRDVNGSDKPEVDVKALQADIRRLQKEFSEFKKAHEADRLRLEKELSEYKKPHEQVQIDKPGADLKSPNTANVHSVANQKPEDVIRVFMMKDFMGRKFVDDLIVPPVAARKK